jgi:hypothetical protein
MVTPAKPKKKPSRFLNINITVPNDPAGNRFVRQLNSAARSQGMSRSGLVNMLLRPLVLAPPKAPARASSDK